MVFLKIIIQNFKINFGNGRDRDFYFLHTLGQAHVRYM